MSMDDEIQNLQAQVQADTDATGSAITLLNQLGDMMRAAADDPAAVRALADSVQGNAQSLADAVAANTPAAPPAP